MNERENFERQEASIEESEAERRDLGKTALEKLPHRIVDGRVWVSIPTRPQVLQGRKPDPNK